MRRSSEGREAVRAAKEIRYSLTAMRFEMLRAGSAAGKLMAILDNAEGSPDLVTNRSNNTFRLFSELTKAYDNLATYLRSVEMPKDL